MTDSVVNAAESADSANHRLGVVVPLANEEATIDEFLRRILAQLGPRDVIICVLDNKSQDGTLERVRCAADHVDARVVALWAPENRCVVDAYFRGYARALEMDCEWILEMDGGFSHSPEEIPRFIAAMEEGAEFAAGSRFLRGACHRGSTLRYLISRGGTILANAMLGTRMHDMTSGFECFSRAALEHIMKQGVRSRAHFFQTEIRTRLSSWNWVEVPISYANPSKSVGIRQMWDALSCLWHLFRERRLTRHS